MIIHRDRLGEVPDVERRLAIDAEINALLESCREQAKTRGIETMTITYSVPAQSVSVEIDSKEFLDFNDEVRERVKSLILEIIGKVRDGVSELRSVID